MRYTRSFLGLLIFLAISAEGLAGLWTTNEFIYKPSQGARGEREKSTYDSGQDRVDVRLAKEVWVGDPKFGATLQDALTALGATTAVLRVPKGTCNLDANLTIPPNITLKPERGAILAIATTKTLTINGKLEAGTRSSLFLHRYRQSGICRRVKPDHFPSVVGCFALGQRRGQYRRHSSQLQRSRRLYLVDTASG